MVAQGNQRQCRETSGDMYIWTQMMAMGDRPVMTNRSFLVATPCIVMCMGCWYFPHSVALAV